MAETKRIWSQKLSGIFLFIFFTTSCTPAYFVRYHPNIAENIFARKVYRIEAKIAQNPVDSNLLLEAVSELTIYSYAFLMEQADREIVKNYHQGRNLYNRAQNIFNRAKDYGLRGIKLQYPEFDSLMTATKMESFPFKRKDVPFLYWTAAAWGGAISASKGDLAYIVEIPKVGWLLERALEAEPEWNKGAIYSAMISYSMKRPNQGGGGEKQARMYFKKALDISAGKASSPYVTLAEVVSTFNQDREEFEDLLKKALIIDIDIDPELKLSNIIAQSRARWLLEQKEELFY